MPGYPPAGQRRHRGISFGGSQGALVPRPRGADGEPDVRADREPVGGALGEPERRAVRGALVEPDVGADREPDVGADAVAVGRADP